MTSARRFVITFLSLLAIWAVQGTEVRANTSCYICQELQECDMEDAEQQCEAACGPREGGYEPVCVYTSNPCGTIGGMPIAMIDCDGEN